MRQVLAILGLLALTGCGGPGRGDVTGVVTFKGKSLQIEGLRVSFIGSDGLPTTAVVDVGGSYTATGVLSGENQVTVTWQPPEGANPAQAGKPKDREVPKTAEEVRALEEAAKKRAQKNPVPDRYSHPARSDLKFTVEPNKSNEFKIDLKP